MWILLSTQKIDSECWEDRLNDRKICLNTQKKQFGLEHYCQSLKYHVRGPKNYLKNNQFLGHLCIITLSFMICVRMFSAPTGNLINYLLHTDSTLRFPPYQSYIIKLLVFDDLSPEEEDSEIRCSYVLDLDRISCCALISISSIEGIKCQVSKGSSAPVDINRNHFQCHNQYCRSLACSWVGPQGQKWSNRHSIADTTRFIPKDAREIVFVFVFGAPS